MKNERKILFNMGQYQILELIGKGGMGEVFLAFDTICGRCIALKRIRPDLIEHKQLRNRFAREALITSKLTHPSIIPIYSIQQDEGLAYYTMPYIKGQTLKQLLATANKQDKKGLKPEHISSIPSLIRIFLSVCQAVAYAHSKGIIHRDIKPHNVIVGQFGEVIILDWGLAKVVGEPTSDDENDIEYYSDSFEELTRVGKVVGTVAYMAPERAANEPTSFQTDVYSLGVILYQILTLRHPFKRTTLAEFRKQKDAEILQDPAEVAPYRDVPPVLSRIVMRCLSKSTEERYSSVQMLLHDLEGYVEGRSEWLQMAELNIRKKSDWEFQENVLIAEHMAITRGADVTEWVSLMISKASFPGNIKIEAKIKIDEGGHGVGFLWSVPDAAERVHLNNGYCLWVGSDLSKSSKLLQSTVEVVYVPDAFMQRNIWHRIRIEMIEDNIYFYLNDTLQFSYISHLPLSGSHVGVLSRDADFEMEDFFISTASQNITVNCLAVPDAFLAHKDYAKAISEYRRIAISFPGTAEGREAMFRAGMTLLEEVKTCADPLLKQKKSEEAHIEFGKLHSTPGAPLEYLGKGLVYQVLEDYEEEYKCFELVFRRYPRHPLLYILHAHLIHRMHDCSRYHRTATYHFIFLAVRYLPESITMAEKLFDSLKKHWEPLYFIEDVSEEPLRIQKLNFTIQLAFWLAQSYSLTEVIDELLHAEHPNFPVVCNGVFALIELGDWQEAERLLPATSDSSVQLIQVLIAAHRQSLDAAIVLLWPLLPRALGKQEMRIIFYLMKLGIRKQNYDPVHQLANRVKAYNLSAEVALLVDVDNTWAYLMEKKWEDAGHILHKYTLEQLSQETTPLHFLYGCWLAATEGKEIAGIHFASMLSMTYPRSWMLFSHFNSGSPMEQHQWLQKTFLWERRQLYRQHVLFNHCVGNEVLARDYASKEADCYIIT